MKKTVHQIWLGGPLPAREAAWVAGVRAAATAAGWAHKLWGEAELEAAFCGEPMHELMKAGLRLVPHPTSYTFAADWYKLRIMAHEPALYLDTDFAITGAWPQLPTAADVYAQEESGARGQGRLNACIYWARTARPFTLACRIGAANILRQLHPLAPDFELQWVNFIRGDAGWSSGVLSPDALAGAFLRRHVLPRWQAAGIRWATFPPEIVGHAKWEQKGILTHMGAGSWLWGAGMAKDGAYWAARAAQAAEHAQQAAIAKQPAHLRPCAASIPPPRRWAAREEPPQAAAAPAAAAPPFLIPAGVERIVVLSNVVQGFPWHELQLQSTDLVIHCGYARHREAAMRVQGTRHWLFVRHGCGGDPRGWHWYHPQNMDGFEKVFFVDDTQLLTPCRWMADYRRLSRKSPTTGFAVANLMREFAPQLPLLLAGFDPGVDHGTPLWEGHDWAAEREWYRQRRFHLLPPQANYE